MAEMFLGGGHSAPLVIKIETRVDIANLPSPVEAIRDRPWLF